VSDLKRWIQILLNIALPLIAIVLTVWLVPKILYFFMPFVIGGIIAFIANPLVRFLERKIRIRRKFGTVLIIGGVLALVIGGGYLILTRIAKELLAFIESLPETINGINIQLEAVLEKLEGTLERLSNGSAEWNLAESIQNMGTNLVNALTGFVAELGAPTVTAAGNIAKSLPNAFVMVFITILSAYFFLAEKEMVASVYQNVMPKKAQKVLQLLYRNAKHLVGGYFLAQFRIMCVVAVMLFVGFLILRIPYAGVWALLIAFLDFLPVFGTGTVLIPWGLLQFLSGKFYMAVGLLACWLLTQAVRQMIQPKIVGDSMGLDPLLTLLFLYLGYRFSGLGGMILAVPVGLIVIELYHYGAFDSLIGGIRDLIDFIRELRGIPEENTDKTTEEVTEKNEEKTEEKTTEKDH
jgi:sporulation integral membrane protein YtvI